MHSERRIQRKIASTKFFETTEKQHFTTLSVPTLLSVRTDRYQMKLYRLIQSYSAAKIKNQLKMTAAYLYKI